MNPIWAVQTNDVVPLLLSSQRSNLRDLRMKDNFNNTFLFKMSFLTIAGSEL